MIIDQEIQSIKRSMSIQAGLISDLSKNHAKLINDLPILIKEAIEKTNNKRKTVQLLEFNGFLNALCDDGSIWVFIDDSVDDRDMRLIKALNMIEDHDKNNFIYNCWYQIKEIR